MTNRDWTFTQLTGSDPKTFVLTGYAAPFGRPRSKPVVTTGTTLRRKQTRYPGNSGTPTTHLFGTLKRPMELKGRWMDKKLGVGSAERNFRLMTEMINDQRPVRITWGELLSYVGWLDEIEVEWEGLGSDNNGTLATECAWILRLLIDEDEFESHKPTIKDNSRLVADTTAEIQAWLNTAAPQMAHSLPSLDAVTGEIFDSLDDLISNVTQFGAAAISIANSINNVETAAFNELERLRAGLHEFKTAVLTLRDTVDNISIDSMIVDRSVEDDIAWLTFQSSSNKQTTDLLNKIAIADAAAEVAAALRIKTTYQAKPGDSWESIALAQYGNASRAGDIRDANSIKGGQQPIPGHQYNIPF